VCATLRPHCDLQYDQLPSPLSGRELLGLGRPVAPSHAIQASDLFIFLCSINSLRISSVAYEELSIARAGRLWPEERVTLILLGETTCPAWFQGRLCARLPTVVTPGDIRAVGARLLRRLAELGGFLWQGSFYVGGGEPDRLLETLLAADRRRSYFELSVPLMKQNTATLIRYASALDIGSQNLLAENLLDLYVSIGDELTRNNVVYLLSRLMPNDEAVGQELLRIRYAPGVSQYSQRSFAVALASLGHRSVLDYLISRMFRSGDRDSWLAHSRYHEFYYGSRELAVASARIQLLDARLPHLTSLAIATLAALSSNPGDIDFLEDMWQVLLSRGVSIKHLRLTRRSIANRTRSGSVP
jgi:hypothetical protein